MVNLEYMFYFQLIFQYHDVINQYADQLFELIHHLNKVLNVIHHALQDAADQNLMKSF